MRNKKDWKSKYKRVLPAPDHKICLLFAYTESIYKKHLKLAGKKTQRIFIHDTSGSIIARFACTDLRKYSRLLLMTE